MADKKKRLEPIGKGKTDPGEFARRVRGINDRLKAEGRVFADSTEIIRADRDSRV